MLDVGIVAADDDVKLGKEGRIVAPGLELKVARVGARRDADGDPVRLEVRDKARNAGKKRRVGEEAGEDLLAITQILLPRHGDPRLFDKNLCRIRRLAAHLLQLQVPGEMLAVALTDLLRGLGVKFFSV